MLGLGHSPSLRSLAESLEEPWQSIMTDHRDAFLEVSREITTLAECNRELLTLGLRSARETLPGLGDEGVHGYRPTARPSSNARHVDSWIGACDVTGTFGSFSTAAGGWRPPRWGGATQAAMWSRHDGHGDGVALSCVTRLSDGLPAPGCGLSTATSTTSTCADRRSSSSSRDWASEGWAGSRRLWPTSTPPR